MTKRDELKAIVDDARAKTRKSLEDVGLHEHVETASAMYDLLQMFCDSLARKRRQVIATAALQGLLTVVQHADEVAVAAHAARLADALIAELDKDLP